MSRENSGNSGTPEDLDLSSSTPEACAPAAIRDGTSGSGSAETSSDGTLLVENNIQERELLEPRVVLPVRDGRRVDRSVPRRTRRHSTPRPGPYDDDNWGGVFSGPPSPGSNNYDDTQTRVTSSRLRDTSSVTPRGFNRRDEEGSGARSSQGEFRVAWTGGADESCVTPCWMLQSGRPRGHMQRHLQLFLINLVLTT